MLRLPAGITRGLAQIQAVPNGTACGEKAESSKERPQTAAPSIRALHRSSNDDALLRAGDDVTAPAAPHSLFREEQLKGNIRRHGEFATSQVLPAIAERRAATPSWVVNEMVKMGAFNPSGKVQTGDVAIRNDLRTVRQSIIVQREHLPSWLMTKEEYNKSTENREKVKGATIQSIVMKLPSGRLLVEKEVMRQWIAENVREIETAIPNGAWLERSADEYCDTMTGRRTKPGEVVYWQQDEGLTHFYIIVDGWLDVIVNGLIMRMYGPGDMFGHEALGASASAEINSMESVASAGQMKVLELKRRRAQLASFSGVGAEVGAGSSKKRRRGKSRDKRRGASTPQRNATVCSVGKCTLLVVDSRSFNEVVMRQHSMFTSSTIEFLRRTECFSPWNKGQLLRAVMQMEEVVVPKGAVIFQSGTRASHLCITRRGVVGLSHIVTQRNGSEAKRIDVRFMNASKGELFGTEASIYYASTDDHIDYATTARALTETRVLKIPAKQVAQTFHKSTLLYIRASFKHILVQKDLLVTKVEARESASRRAVHNCSVARGPKVGACTHTHTHTQTHIEREGERGRERERERERETHISMRRWQCAHCAVQPVLLFALCCNSHTRTALPRFSSLSCSSPALIHRFHIILTLFFLLVSLFSPPSCSTRRGVKKSRRNGALLPRWRGENAPEQRRCERRKKSLLTQNVGRRRTESSQSARGGSKKGYRSETMRRSRSERKSW